MKLENKVVVVTGSGGAIGSSLLTYLKGEGAVCVSIDKNQDLVCDFANTDSVVEVSKRISNEYTKIDMLFNVAGVGVYKDIETLEINEWQDSFAVNVQAPFILSKYLLPSLKMSDKPLIFNIGSGMGVMPTKGRLSYCASKFALRGFSLALSKELDPYGIDVCLLTLGSVMTPFGTGGLAKRKQLEQEGKQYLKVEQVINKIDEILNSENREPEYVMYPEGYSI